MNDKITMSIEHEEGSEYPWRVKCNGNLCAMFKHKASAIDLICEDPEEIKGIFWEDAENGGLIWLTLR